jgi:hypothetical protein
MFILLTVTTADTNIKNEDISQTGSQWLIVRRYSDTTITDTMTIPSVEQYATVASIERYTAFLTSVFQFIAFFGIVFLLAGILAYFAPKSKKN